MYGQKIYYSKNIVLFDKFLPNLPLIITMDYGSIPYDPPQSAENWCDNQPCTDCGSFILSQPFSSVVVYLTAILTIAVGIYFLRTKKDQKSRQWLGIALLLVGIGAALAGTSYQAFGYEIKCRDRDFCVWTSWWEIAYMVCTVMGVGALMISIFYTVMSKKGIHICKLYTLVSSIIYIILVVVGSIIPIKFLITFEMMLIFVLPIYLAIFVLSTQNYRKNRDELAKKLLIGCVLLFVAIGAYYLYFMLEITQLLWEQGIWFSDNDVLHILMCVWIIYILKAIGPILKDSHSSIKDL
jgi:uncharacterized protein DUF6962